MAEERVERRLAAILAMDVAGFSRMMEEAEEATLTALKQIRHDLVDPGITAHGGRIFKTMGDGLLAEFASVLNAARAAVAIQSMIAARNGNLSVDRRITLRIGLNLGDVIVDGDDVYGDGVNLAARLEGMAEPGGIACSAAARQQIGNRLGLCFLDRGEQRVKNMHPVHVYFIDPETTEPRASSAAPHRPTVAILPFANLSTDPEQEFFSDGITEDIITDLSRVSGLAVLSRNTAFSLKGKTLVLSDVARQLGVDFLVEGSVRRAGNRVRITAQLIDGSADRHLWAERYDRDLTDIFAVQDEITSAIVSQLKVRLLPAEKDAIGKVPTGSIEAYTLYLKGRQHFWEQTKASLELARRLFLRATELDPHYALAFAGLVNCDSYLCFAHGVQIPQDLILANADKAVALDPGLAEAHACRGAALSDAGRDAEATAEFEQALALDPNSMDTHALYGEFCLMRGNYPLAALHYERATEIQPDGHRSPMILRMVLDGMKRKDDARHFAMISLERAERERALRPHSVDPLLSGASVLAAIGRRAEALEWLSMARTIDPNDRRTSYMGACTLALLGDFDEALDELEVTVAKSGDGVIAYVSVDADLDAIRDHPRFVRIMASATERSDHKG